MDLGTCAGEPASTLALAGLDRYTGGPPLALGGRGRCDGDSVPALTLGRVPMPVGTDLLCVSAL